MRLPGGLRAAAGIVGRHNNSYIRYGLLDEYVRANALQYYHQVRCGVLDNDLIDCPAFILTCDAYAAILRNNVTCLDMRSRVNYVSHAAIGLRVFTPGVLYRLSAWSESESQRLLFRRLVSKSTYDAICGYA